MRGIQIDQGEGSCNALDILVVNGSAVWAIVLGQKIVRAESWAEVCLFPGGYWAVRRVGKFVGGR